MPKGKPHNPAMRSEWVRYWDDPSSPHPDVERLQREGRAKTARPTAPFSIHRQTHYVHHYRLSGEHYHSSMQDLERCSK
jgi:hypothetical protein